MKETLATINWKVNKDDEYVQIRKVMTSNSILDYDVTFFYTYGCVWGHGLIMWDIRIGCN